LKQWLEELLNTCRWRTFGSILGIVIGILILTINFWRTLVLCIVVGLFYFIGSLLDRGGLDQIKELLDRILPWR